MIEKLPRSSLADRPRGRITGREHGAIAHRPRRTGERAEAAKNNFTSETLPSGTSGRGGQGPTIMNARARRRPLSFNRLETVQVGLFLDWHLGVGLGLGKFVQALLRPDRGERVGLHPLGASVGEDRAGLDCVGQLNAEYFKKLGLDMRDRGWERRPRRGGPDCAASSRPKRENTRHRHHYENKRCGRVRGSGR